MKFFLLNLATLTARIKDAVASKPAARRTCSLAAPRRELELLAQQHLIALGLMAGLLDCWLIFFLLAHSSEGVGPELMHARMWLRDVYRPQALGCSGIGVDLDLGLRLIIEAKFGTTIEALFESVVLPGEHSVMWTNEQILRVVLRYGLSVHAFPWYVVRWAACFFGMVRPHTHT